MGQANFYVPPDCLMRCQPCFHNNPPSFVDFDSACVQTSELTVYMLTYRVKRTQIRLLSSHPRHLNHIG